MDSRMARVCKRLIGSSELVRETLKKIVFVLPMGMEREKMVVLTRVDIQIWGNLRPLSG